MHSLFFVFIVYIVHLCCSTSHLSTGNLILTYAYIVYGRVKIVNLLVSVCVCVF